jgi:hypothetical protein
MIFVNKEHKKILNICSSSYPLAFILFTYKVCRYDDRHLLSIVVISDPKPANTVTATLDTTEMKIEDM